MAVEGADSFARELRGIGQRAEARNLFDSAAAVFHDIHQQVFDGEGPPGYGWEPHSGSPPGSGRLLVESGGLLDSLTTPDSAWSVATVQGDDIRLGTSAPHAHLHHEGTARIPARQLLDTSQAAEERIVAAASQTVFSDDERMGL